MKRVAVVTDSSASIPASQRQELEIHVVPILLTMGDQTYRDSEEIAADDVYRWLRSKQPLPKTSSPPVGDFAQCYERLSQKSAGIVSIHISPELSGIYNAARMGSQMVEGVPIRVMDCRSAAMGQGFVVLEAARAAATGATLHEVMARAEEVSRRVRLLATIPTLEYLHRGGRIGGAAALLGTMLQIKPVLTVVDGRVELFSRPHSQARAVSAMLEEMERQVRGRPLHVAVLHADAVEEAESLLEQVSARFACVEVYVTPLTPVMGAHTGPGVLGVAFYAD
jgi:DegV family protein with EDD domain